MGGRFLLYYLTLTLQNTPYCTCQPLEIYLIVLVIYHHCFLFKLCCFSNLMWKYYSEVISCTLVMCLTHLQMCVFTCSLSQYSSCLPACLYCFHHHCSHHRCNQTVHLIRIILVSMKALYFFLHHCCMEYEWSVRVNEWLFLLYLIFSVFHTCWRCEDPRSTGMTIPLPWILIVYVQLPKKSL